MINGVNCVPGTMLIRTSLASAPDLASRRDLWTYMHILIGLPGLHPNDKANGPYRNLRLTNRCCSGPVLSLEDLADSGEILSPGPMQQPLVKYTM